MWGWRTAILCLDSVYLIMALKKKKPEEMPMQRMKRADEFSSFMTASFALIDLELTGLYLATIPKEDKRGREVANEVVALLPSLFCGIRHSGPTGAAALALLDVAAAFTNFGLGVQILKDDVKALS